MIEVKSNLSYEQEVVDRITGFKGKIVAITKWQNGCIRLGVKPVVGEDGKIIDTEWFDEVDLILVEDVITKGPGGPTGVPKRNPDPSASC